MSLAVSQVSPPRTDARVIPSGVPQSVLLSTYSASQWEIFIEEWMQGFAPPYIRSERVGGSGDKGRDVVGYHGSPSNGESWDNYQCKHYSRPLRPSDIWIELGKMCFYSWRGDFPPPSKYRFVAPKEVSPTLQTFLANPLQLREGLVLNWDGYCKSNITTTDIPLEGELYAYVQTFDFSIFGYEPLVSLLMQHSKTPFWAHRFRTALPSRPAAPPPPQSPTPLEARYVQQLLGVYAQRENAAISSPDELKAFASHFSHFQRSRERFYSAESLHRFSRDYLTPGAFEKFKRQIYDGVIDTVESLHPDGLARLQAAVAISTTLVVSQTELGQLAEVADKQGACHHLANEDKLIW